jgi:hypothetical protein
VAACAEEATAPQPSPTAAQADAIAVQSVIDFLKAEAERPKAVTKLLAHHQTLGSSNVSAYVMFDALFPVLLLLAFW